MAQLIKLSMDAADGRAPRRAVKFSNPEAFQAQRWAAARSCSRAKRAWCAGSMVSNRVSTLLKMTVNSSFQSCAAAAAIAQDRSGLVFGSTFESKHPERQNIWGRQKSSL
jgi:hypothetical protein